MKVITQISTVMSNGVISTPTDFSTFQQFVSTERAFKQQIQHSVEIERAFTEISRFHNIVCRKAAVFTIYMQKNRRRGLKYSAYVV